MSMQRRTFVSTAGLAAASAAVAAPAIAQSAPELRWRLASSFPKSLDNLFGTAQTFARYVAEATDNRFQIQTFAAGEIVGGLQVLDVVANGSVECGHGPLQFYTGRAPVLGMATALPFGLNARQQHAWWHFAGGKEIINETLAGYNTLGIVCGNSGTQMGGFFRREVNTPEDLKGLKMRIAGTGGEVLSRLGVIAQTIAPGDIYPALERGVLDACEFVSPYDDEKLGFVKVAKYYYAPGFWEGGAQLHLMVNQAKWAELPKSYQAVIAQASEAANNWMLARYDYLNAQALRRMVAGGAELRIFSQPILEACLKAANELYAELSAKNPAFKKGYESLVAYRSDVLPWWQLNEYTFDSFMVRTRGRI